MRVRKPKRQGAFDKACGFYAVHNALSLLYPGVVGDDDFSTLLGALSRVTVPKQFFFGTGRNELNRMLGHILDDNRFSPTSVQRPWWTGGVVPLKDYWARLDDHLSQERSAAIVMVGHEPTPDNTFNHWTVVRKVTARSLILHDSDGLGRIPRLRSRVRDGKESNSARPYSIDHTATFLLRREV